MAQSARRRNGNIARGHGGKPDRALRRKSEWKARETDGFDPAARACLNVMRSGWPHLIRKAMAVLGADDMNAARAVLALRELVEWLAVSVHNDFNRGGVRDFRDALAPIPAMQWPPDVQAWFDQWGDDGRWASDAGGLPGGNELAGEMQDAMESARP